MKKNTVLLKLYCHKLHIQSVRFVLTFIFFFSLNVVYGQVVKDTIYYDATSRQVKKPDSNGYYRIVSYELAGEIHFIVKDYFPTGKLKMVGVFKSLNPDRKNGEFTWYYPNGIKRKECSYVENKLEGPYKLWYENGKQQQTSFYKDDKQEGTTLSWSEDGLLKKQIEYKNGLKNGKFLSFYKNGNPVREEIYKHDVLVEGKCFTSSGADTVYFEYFSPPSFLGGDIAQFKSWILEKLQYPAEARVNKEEGEVNVKFTIDKTGKVKTVQITKQDKNYFNSEVLRVIADSPLWKPAMHDTDTIEVTVEIPVKFTLPKQ